MYWLRLSNPIILVLGGGLLYTCLTFPFVQASTFAREFNTTEFYEAYRYSFLCFVLLCLGLLLGVRLSRRQKAEQVPSHETGIRDLRPLMARSMVFWFIGLAFTIVIFVTIFGGFGSMATSVATRNDLVRGKAWLFTLILPLKVGVFGILFCILTTKVTTNRIWLIAAFVPMLLISIFFLNVIGGRLFVCGLVLQLLILSGQCLYRHRKVLFFAELLSAICLVFVVGVFGMDRYATSVGLSRDVDPGEVVQEILSDEHSRDRMLLDNFFDPWYVLQKSVEHLRAGNSPTYGLYHAASLAKVVPGLHRYIDKHLDVNEFHSDLNLGMRTVPYSASVFLEFQWAGAGVFFLLGFALSYAIERLRAVEERSEGIKRLFANYTIGCICIFGLYLFRSGLTVFVSFGFAEFAVLGSFYLMCLIRIQPVASVGWSKEPSALSRAISKHYRTAFWHVSKSPIHGVWFLEPVLRSVSRFFSLTFE